MPPTPRSVRAIDHKALALWARACLQAAGVSSQHSGIVAEALVQTSLWGIDSHGITRLPHYLSRIQAGSIDPKPRIEIRETGPCTAQVSGGHGLGIVVCDVAMNAVMQLAEKNGVGVVGVAQSSHCGAIGLYTRKAARAGLIGVALTHSDALVVPFGGTQRFLGTNPISFAFPRQGSHPLCLDMATSAVPWNLVMNARRLGRALPEDVAVDKNGTFTTDPDAAAALFPLGGNTHGYKGFGLALAIDLLCGPLNGMPFGPHVPLMYGELSARRHLGSLMMALDPHRFGGGDDLADAVETMTRELREQPGHVMCPGDPEYTCEKQRIKNGIPVDDELLKEMGAWSHRLGVPALTESPLSRL